MAALAVVRHRRVAGAGNTDVTSYAYVSDFPATLHTSYRPASRGVCRTSSW